MAQISATCWQAPPARITLAAEVRRTMKMLALNHVALHVADVERSVAFYRDVLHLEPIPRPAFNFPGAWFRLGTDQELHLIGGREAQTQSHNRGNHWALQIDDMDAWENDLQSHGVAYLPRRTRPDGALQIYLVDPDGHYIELCQLH
jgi:catechol 2,3-dioxygenase-like lactoylglutathione lyase family enzyme